MSDETLTAAPSGEPTVAAPVSSPEPVSAPEPSIDSVTNLALSRDVSGFRKEFDRVMSQVSTSQENAEPSPKSKDATVATEPKTEPKPQSETQPLQPKKYVVGNGPDVLELTDEDGYLGYKDVDTLKKTAANQILHMKHQKQWFNEAQEQLRQERQARTELENRLKAFEAQKPATPTAAAPTAPASAPAEKPTFELAGAPAKPQLPEDPASWTPEDYKAWNTWQDQNLKHTEQMVSGVKEYAEKLASATTANLDPSHPVLQEITNLKTTIADLQQMANEFRKSKEDMQRQQAEQNYWNERESFMQLHADEFKAPKPLREMYKQIVNDGNNLAWMDYVALSNGIQRPIDSDPKNWENYNNQRNAVTNKFLSGDKQVIANCEARGVEPPAGYKEYFSLAEKFYDLDNEHQSLKNLGRLGPKSTLQDAWEMLNRDKLTTQVVNMERQARANGANDVIDALVKQKQEFAATVPPSLSQTGDTPITPDKIEELLKSAHKNAHNPTALEEIRKLSESLVVQ